jgi:dTDP-4-dehydrorhamnose reductase
LLTGANGQIGWELGRSLSPLGEVIALGRDQCDLAQPERLPSVLRDVNPDIIVNAAAYTAVNNAEREEALASTVNGKSVGVLAEEARRAGAVLVHYSTDYVFDGMKHAPYTEDDVPCPINAYGRSKLAGDTAIRELGGAYIVLRTSWVYAARGHNFMRTILRLGREREKLRIVSDQVGAPTWAREIAEATRVIIQAVTCERAEGRFASGLFNLTASGTTSWHGFAQAILEAAKCNGLFCAHDLPQLDPVRSEDYPSPAARPKNSRLTCDRIRARFGVSPADWNCALALCIAEMHGTDGLDALLPRVR